MRGYTLSGLLQHTGYFLAENIDKAREKKSKTKLLSSSNE